MDEPQVIRGVRVHGDASFAEELLAISTDMADQILPPYMAEMYTHPEARRATGLVFALMYTSGANYMPVHPVCISGLMFAAPGAAFQQKVDEHDGW